MDALASMVDRNCEYSPIQVPRTSINCSLQSRQSAGKPRDIHIGTAFRSLRPFAAPYIVQCVGARFAQLHNQSATPHDPRASQRHSLRSISSGFAVTRQSSVCSVSVGEYTESVVGYSHLTSSTRAVLSNKKKLPERSVANQLPQFRSHSLSCRALGLVQSAQQLCC